MINLKDRDKVKNNNNKKINKIYHIKKELFPYKYYLYSIFLKNLGVS